MAIEKDYDEMTDAEKRQYELDELDDEYYKTQNQMDNPYGEDD